MRHPTSFTLANSGDSASPPGPKPFDGDERRTAMTTNEYAGASASFAPAHRRIEKCSISGPRWPWQPDACPQPASRPKRARQWSPRSPPESRRVFATLVRLLGDTGSRGGRVARLLRAAAVEKVARSRSAREIRRMAGVGRAIQRSDAITAPRTVRRLLERIARQLDEHTARRGRVERRDSRRRRLRLIFTCCHPAIRRKLESPSRCAEVCGHSQPRRSTAPHSLRRAHTCPGIVRAKSKIRDARIPTRWPGARRDPPSPSIRYFRIITTWCLTRILRDVGDFR